MSALQEHKSVISAVHTSPNPSLSNIC